jgi:uncharacterized protein YybS (DUF2232 family)
MTNTTTTTLPIINNTPIINTVPDLSAILKSKSDAAIEMMVASFDNMWDTLTTPEVSLDDATVAP